MENCSTTWSHANLAEAYRRSGDMVKAKEAVRNGRDILARLVPQRPDFAPWKSFDAQLAAEVP